MRWHWPWTRGHRTENNGHVAREAKEKAERAKENQKELWPEVIWARDELARLAEQAMRGRHL